MQTSQELIKEEITDKIPKIIKKYPNIVVEIIKKEFHGMIENINNKDVKLIETKANKKIAHIIKKDIKINQHIKFASNLVRDILIKLFEHKKIQLKGNKHIVFLKNKPELIFYLNWKGLNLIGFKINQEGRLYEINETKDVINEIKEKINHINSQAIEISKEKAWIKRSWKANKLFLKVA